MKTRLLSISGWLMAIILGGLFMAEQAGAAPFGDDVQLRVYKDGYGVVVQVPTYGNTPTYYSFPITGGTHDAFKVGNHYVDIGWGEGPGGVPLVTIDASADSPHK